LKDFIKEKTKDPYKEALYWVQDYLARRPHSEKELFDKLLKKDFDEVVSKKAVAFAKDSGWMEDPFEMAQKVYDEWDRKNKSHSWIKNYLYEKGLPIEIEKNIDRERDKAYYHLKKRFNRVSSDNYKKAASGLSSKGFSYDEFSQALEILKNESDQG